MSNPSVDVSATIDKSTLGRFQIMVIGLCALVALLDGFDNQGIAYVAPVIARQWNIPIAAFGPIFATGLLGFAIGSVLFGMAADRVGRRQTILWSVLMFSLLNLATGFAESFGQLLTLRFITGIGLGGATTNIVALTAEYAPARWRATLVNAMFCAFPLGSTLGGVLATKLIPAWGWASVFYLGGILPLILLVVLVPALPESIRFMVARGAPSEKIAAVLAKIDPTVARGGVQYTLAETKAAGFPVSHLIKDGRAVLTSLLWLAFFANLMVMLFLVNWLPSLLREVGIPIETAILATPVLNIGGILGSIVLGYLIDRLGPYGVLSSVYVIAAIAIAIAATAGGNLTVFMAAVFCAGIGVVGGQNGMNAVAASLYPTVIRSTGVGWAFGIGRIGAVAGPLIGGLMLGAGWTTQSVILAAAVPALVAAVAVFGMSAVGRGQATAQPGGVAAAR